jgi:hypothetical protein
MSHKVDPRLENLAKKVLAKTDIPQDDNYGSVMLILMVISIIISLVRVIQECQKNKLANLDISGQKDLMKSEISNISIRKTWLNQLRLNRILKRHMSKEDYVKHGSQLKNAILECGPELDDEDTTALVNVINGPQPN